MDILKAEIARKRKKIEDCQVLVPDKKFFKRGDLAAKEEEEYWEKHGSLKDVILGRKKSEKEEDDLSDPSTSSDAEQKSLPRKEVIRRLRERCEPIRLFGESDFEAYKRLRKLEILEPEVTRGLRNELKEAKDQLEQEYLTELLHAKGTDEKIVNPNNVKFKDDGKLMSDIVEMSLKMDKGDVVQDQNTISTFLRLLQTAWGKALNDRDENVKGSAKGKLEAAQFRQTDQYIIPLMQYLEGKNTPNDILESLVKITLCMLRKEYIKANDFYMEMAIGNAAWPVGVTNPGIHSRPGREKIYDKHVAHVLNDETQRKYIQGLKRLMTQCQLLFPGDPSKSVNYSFEKM